MFVGEEGSSIIPSTRGDILVSAPAVRSTRGYLFDDGPDSGRSRGLLDYQRRSTIGGESHPGCGAEEGGAKESYAHLATDADGVVLRERELCLWVDLDGLCKGGVSASALGDDERDDDERVHDERWLTTSVGR